MAQVVSRRHPLAFAMYVMVLCLGLIFIFQWFGTGQTENAIFPGVPEWMIETWKWEMTTGAAVSVLGLLLPARQSPSWPDLADLLHFEAVGSFVSAIGLATFASAGVILTGPSHAVSSLVLYGVLVLGHLWRSGQALWEARKLVRLATALAVEEARHGNE